MAKEQPAKFIPYKNFEYRKIAEGRWEIKFPSGFKAQISLASEEVVKAHIDMLRADHGEND